MTETKRIVGWLKRYRLQLNLGALIALGIWAGWVAWITRPSESPSGYMSPICWMRTERLRASPPRLFSRDNRAAWVAARH